MSNKTYGQYCGLANALELIGERWALLIIRDLLVGPRRFSDLHAGLPKIPTNILTTRLKELEQSGIVARRALPRPSKSVVYELTPYGLELEDAVKALGLWGAKTLAEPRPEDIITPDSLTMALRTTFCPDAVKQNLNYELRFGDLILHAQIQDGQLTVGQGALTAPDLIIYTGPAFKSLIAGELSPQAALNSGAVNLKGPPELLEHFVELFRIPAPAASNKPA